jgi:hypothetical protein
LALLAPRSKEKRFWHALWPIDETGVLSTKAILAAKDCLGINVLVAKLLPLQIREGLKIYNEVSGGVFEKVILQQDGQDDLEFYIYNLSDAPFIF